MRTGNFNIVVFSCGTNMSRRLTEKIEKRIRAFVFETMKTE
jgi:hypothetical protein